MKDAAAMIRQTPRRRRNEQQLISLVDDDEEEKEEAILRVDLQTFFFLINLTQFYDANRKLS